jgi:hypothetical protein
MVRRGVELLRLRLIGGHGIALYVSETRNIYRYKLDLTLASATSFIRNAVLRKCRQA